MDVGFPRSEWLARQISLIGSAADAHLESASVMVFGVGGVGGAAVEALARAGVGRITVVDHDTFSASNLNRQILCRVQDVGKSKAQTAAERIAQINPACRVEALPVFVTAENAAELIAGVRPDFICDAVDNVTAKLAILEYASQNGIRVISCMGTGNKLDPSQFRIAPIEKTSVCPLARVMRYECRKRDLRGIPVLYSTEPPVRTDAAAPASISFVPTCAGLMIAGYIIRALSEIH